MGAFDRTSLLNVTRAVWTTQLLVRDLPVDSYASWAEVHYSDAGGGIQGLLVTPPDNATALWLPFNQLLALEDHRAIVRELDARIRAWHDSHWLATFNVWPGWRI